MIGTNKEQGRRKHEGEEKSGAQKICPVRPRLLWHNLLNPAEFLAVSLVALTIGAVHGGIIARALRARFPSFKTHAKSVSIALLLLFSVNSILALTRFGQAADNMEISSFGSENLARTLFGLIGIDGGLLSILSISVMVMIFVLGRFAKIEGFMRYFVLALSAGTIFLSVIYRLLGLVPDGGQILSYAVYHVGFNAGLFLVLSREQMVGRTILRGIMAGLLGLACKLFRAISSRFRD